MRKYIVIFLNVICFALVAQTENRTVISNFTSEQFKTAFENDKNGVLIDLRTTDEIINKGFIKGSIQLDFLARDAEKQIDKLDKHKTYYVYCAGGGRSSDCALYMEKNGFKKVINLEKGFSNWEKSGFAVEKK